jgi:hypothetical protein
LAAADTADGFVPKFQRFFLDRFDLIARKQLALLREPKRYAISSNGTFCNG